MTLFTVLTRFRTNNLKGLGATLTVDRGTPAEYSAGLKLAIERGWLEIHDSGTFVKFTAAGADLFA
jgi:hypothetical protein